MWKHAMKHFMGLNVPPGRGMCQTPLGDKRRGRNERKKRRVNGSATRGPSSTMDDPREELVKGNGNFCRVSGTIPRRTVKRMPKRCTGHWATKTRRETHFERQGL
ncbi:hypothetical protein TNCV_3266971 [Trichonephila clavipes]|nr:hypothetical protein TNCV_3266971 [Trichonephila clavipes]